MSEQQLTWPQVIDRIGPKFNEIANRSQLVTWAEESQFSLQAIQKSDALAKCSLHTIQNAVINVAAIGLTLNPALGYSYLVPEAGECNLKISFKGLLKIATDSGSILWAKAEIVREKDSFEYLGICTPPEHKMNPFSDRGATVGVYCVAKTNQGDYLVDYMDMTDITRVKNAAKTKNVWTAWPDEMTKKAMIKRASKQWPKTDKNDRLEKAVAHLNEDEGSEELPRKERDITPKEPVVVVGDADIESLRDALKVADYAEETFCKSAGIVSLDQLALARFAGAMAHIQGKAK
jgi:recombination protein RecT